MVGRIEAGTTLPSPNVLPDERGPAPDADLVRRIRAEIRLDDRAFLTRYGESAQRGVAEFADTVLQATLNKDSGAVGDLLTDLIGTVQRLDPATLAKAGLFDRLWGGAKARLLRFKEQFAALGAQVERIALELERRSDALQRDIAMLDALFARNLAQMRELEAYITAGEQVIEDARTTRLPALEARARAADGATREGPLLAQQAADLAQSVERLERRIHDLTLSRTIALQAMPQIRLVQNGDAALVEKLQASLVTTIPTWKNGMTIALALHRQDEALRLQRAVSDTTNALLRANAERLKAGRAGIEREVQRGVVEVETLSAVNRDFIETIDAVRAIQREGRDRRRAAEAALKRIEAELTRTLVAPA
ncbi:toxic anion resistance protein [Methylobacterium sp. Leaf118]|uniref:toxic anion resistance protein n=1 Tax=Methylobacterium sp. Leaf118 TaxID=2876562 RepID=UPI001E5B30A7|nr:toxic anion resistance protein [Methylobacterium sp. Leaf118]